MAARRYNQLLSRIRRFREVGFYIDKHLDEPLSLDTLADVARISPYHFEREFASYTGETPMMRVRRLRLMRACRELQYGGGSVTQTAFRAGYASSQAFSRAFHRLLGLPPSKVPTLAASPRPRLRIEWLEPFTIQYLPFSGAADDLWHTFDEVRTRALQGEIELSKRISWEIHPGSDWPEKYGPKVHIAMRAALMSDPLGMRLRGFDVGHMPGGHYAVFSLEGTYNAPWPARIAERVESETGWRLREGPCMRRFRNRYILPAQGEFACDFYVPVKPNERNSNVRVHQLDIARVLRVKQNEYIRSATQLPSLLSQIGYSG